MSMKFMSLSSPCSEPEIKEWTIWQQEFYKRKFSWKCHTERFPEVVNGETVYVKWLKMFCTVQIVFCASEAGINQKQTASLVELNPEIYLGVLWM